MQNYVELIQRIFSNSTVSKMEALKKLIYLSVNDQNSFSQHVPEIAKKMPKTLQYLEDEQVKLLSLQLLSEMATNFTAKIPAECYSFPQLVALLSDQNPEVRKSAHYLILIFIKKYEQLDGVIEGYLQRIRQSPDHWKILQKIIHSFQSLLVIEPKCISYSQNFTFLDDFMGMLLENRNHHHSLVQKASEQVRFEIIQTVSSFVKNQYVPEILPKMNPLIMNELIEYAEKLSINLKPKKKVVQAKEYDDLEQIPIASFGYRKKSILDQLLEKLDTESDWKIKSDTIEEISRELGNGSAELPEDLVEKVLDLTYDYNFKTCITSMNVLLTIVSLYPNKIASQHRQIEDVVIDKICDLKMAVRQLANKILRKLYQNHSKDFIKRILNKLSNCSIIGKEEILNFLQETFTANIMTDSALILNEISNQLSNENTRIKIKAIDCLVKISTANDLEECKMILSKKLNKVYYDMFLERLREKTGAEKNDPWDQNPKMKKGMTWQAERSAPVMDPVEKQAMTKVEFGNKRNFYETEEDFAVVNPTFEKKNEKNLSSTISNTYKTANTFDTFKSQDEISLRTSKPDNKKSENLIQPHSYISLDYEAEKSAQEKKIPMKPNPIKKRNANNPQGIAGQGEEKNILVIESKEYMNKNTDDIYEPKREEPVESEYFEKKSSLESKPKLKIRGKQSLNKNKLKKQEEQDEKEDIIEHKKQVPSEPFSIKKSGSKKEHVIDYKATHYAAKEELAPLENPKNTLKIIMTNLPKENDWNKQFESLDFLRRLIKNHDDIYSSLSQSLPGIVPEVLKLVESLRSSVAKNAMITLSEMCEALKKSMDPFLEPIFLKLFKKAQDANTFIVEEVRKCMSSLCSYCTSSKIAHIIILNSNAKAAPIKTKVALCIDKILQKKDYDSSLLKENPKLVSVMSNYIIDSSAEVRNLTKDIFHLLIQSNNSSEIEGIFKRASSKDAWERWNALLDKGAPKKFA